MNAPVTLFTEGNADDNSSELVSLAFELARDRRIVTCIGQQDEFQVKTTLSVVDNGLAYDSWVIAKGQVDDLVDELRSVRRVKEIGHDKQQISRVALEAARLHIERCELIRTQYEFDSPLFELPLEEPDSNSDRVSPPYMHTNSESTQNFFPYLAIGFIMLLAGSVFFFAFNNPPKTLVRDIAASNEVESDWQSRVTPGSPESQPIVEPSAGLVINDNIVAAAKPDPTLELREPAQQASSGSPKVNGSEAPKQSSGTVAVSLKQQPVKLVAADVKTNQDEPASTTKVAKAASSETEVEFRVQPAVEKVNKQITESAAAPYEKTASSLSDEEALDLIAKLIGKDTNKTASVKDSVFKTDLQTVAQNAASQNASSQNASIKAKPVSSVEKSNSISVETELVIFLEQQ